MIQGPFLRLRKLGNLETVAPILFSDRQELITTGLLLLLSNGATSLMKKKPRLVHPPVLDEPNEFRFSLGDDSHFVKRSRTFAVTKGFVVVHFLDVPSVPARTPNTPRSTCAFVQHNLR